MKEQEKFSPKYTDTLTHTPGENEGEEGERSRTRRRDGVKNDGFMCV